MSKAYLVLSDGTVFEGTSFGAAADSVGELVFTTGVCGYLETLTDPGYAGQIVLQTFPLIGNYGVIEEDFDGQCALKGYVVREWCDTPSNFRSQYDLDAFLKAQGIPGICGVDTRAITRIIREKGVMNAMICAEVPADLSVVSGYVAAGLVEQVACKAASVHPAVGKTEHRVTMIDYGHRHYLVSELQKRGCEVTVVPANATAAEILAGNPDGVLLSNGPGDPAKNAEYIAQVAKLLGRVPVFGVGLGHQLIALAAGAKTEKMNHGHRGANQPVRDLQGTRTHITSQNHGYVVVKESVTKGVLRYVNANDQSCEGIDYPEWNAFSVQFHPDPTYGPMDTSFLFDRFISMMGGEDACR